MKLRRFPFSHLQRHFSTSNVPRSAPSLLQKGNELKYERRVIIVDDVPPEANAMLQALYSRSPKSVTEHLKQVQSIGHEKFMKNYYVGYGHKSTQTRR